MKNWLLLIILITLHPLYGQQSYSSKKKQTSQKGAAYFFWGYNRSVFGKSRIEFEGPGYDFTLLDVTAHDDPARDLATYFNPTALTTPQFNIRLGYYYKSKYDISIGYDHMKYVMTGNQVVSAFGEIDSVANPYLAGDYANTPMKLNPNAIHYKNNGLNYLSFQIQHTNYFHRSRNRKHYFNYRFGLGLGGVVTKTDFVWKNVSYAGILKLSGFGASVHAGLRADFFNRFFLQSNWSFGYINLPNLQTTQETESRVKQQFIYDDWQIVAGFFLYKRVRNGCDSCPDWN